MMSFADGGRAKLIALSVAIGLLVGFWGPRSGGIFDVAALVGVILLATKAEAPVVLGWGAAAGIFAFAAAWPWPLSLLLAGKTLGTMGLVGWAVRQGWRPTVAVATAMVPTALVVTLGASSAETVRAELLRSGQAMEGTLAALGLSEAGRAGALEPAVTALVALFPSLALLSALADVVIAMALAAPLGRRLGIAIPVFPTFRSWRLWDEFIWVFIVSLGLAFFGAGWSGQLGLNLAVLSGVPYAVQGLAIVAWAMGRWRVSWLGRLVVCILFIVGGLMSLGLLLALGVVDTWVDVRGLSRKVEMSASSPEEMGQ